MVDWLAVGGYGSDDNDEDYQVPAFHIMPSIDNGLMATSVKSSRELVYQTYDKWKALGYIVKKGEKSHKRNDDGLAIFEYSQVKEL